MSKKISGYIDENEGVESPLADLLVFDESHDEPKKAITPGVGFDVDNIIRDYVEGYPRSYIHVKYGISNGQLSSHISARGVPLRNPKQRKSTLGKRLSHLSSKDIQNLLNDYQAGMKTKDLFTKYKIHKNGLYTLLDAHKIKRKRGE